MPMIRNPRPVRVFASTLSSKPWCPPGVALIGAHREWAAARGAGIVVAVVDTGVDYNHPDLKSQIIGGKNFVGSGDDYYDQNGHGTHVAGTIAANGRLLGVAPEARLLIARVLDAQGQGDAQTITKALDWIGSWKGPKGEKVSIINFSLGMRQDDGNLHQMVTQLARQGITMVAAAGNEGDANPATDEISYPAYWIEVLAVGAVDLARRAANFTNTNDHIAVVAPGVNTYSTFPGGKYVQLSGTSMATPHISGASALLHSLYLKHFGTIPDPEWTYRYLKLNTIDLGTVGYDDLFGYGLFSFNPSGGHYLRFSTGNRTYYDNEQAATLNYPLLNRQGVAYISMNDLKETLNIDYEWLPQPGKLEVWD